MSLHAGILSTPVSGIWDNSCSAKSRPSHQAAPTTEHHNHPKSRNISAYRMFLYSLQLPFPAPPSQDFLDKLKFSIFLGSPFWGMAWQRIDSTPLHTCPAPGEKAMWKGIVMCRIRLTEPSRAFRDLWKHISDCNINILWCYKIFPNTVVKRFPMNQWHHIIKLKLALSLPSFFPKIYIPCNPHNVLLTHKKTQTYFPRRMPFCTLRQSL